MPQGTLLYPLGFYFNAAPCKVLSLPISSGKYGCRAQIFSTQGHNRFKSSLHQGPLTRLTPGGLTSFFVRAYNLLNPNFVYTGPCVFQRLRLGGKAPQRFRVFRGRFFSLSLQKSVTEMKKLVVIDACIRGEESRTRRIAEPVIRELAKRYEITRFDLTTMPLEPLTPRTYAERMAGNVPEWALQAAKTLAEAERIVLAAPFWDMSFPSVVKVFFEHLSLFGITFTDNGHSCTGMCKCEKVM